MELPVELLGAFAVAETGSSESSQIECVLYILAYHETTTERAIEQLKVLFVHI